MEKPQKLLSEVIKIIDALKTAQSLYVRQLAPEFNIFDYINTDELGLSRILAELLNPQGTHGQHAEFLRSFIKHCLPSIVEDDNWHPFIEYLEGTNVIVEETTWASDTRRRMDIYIECIVDDKSYGICIENKPYASDEFEQLKDYAIELESRKLTHWHLIYLNEHSDTPSEHSIKADKLDAFIKENKFSVLKFSDLIDWLKTCQVQCQNHSVTEFLTQLIKFIQKQFMGIESMNTDNAVLEMMQKNEDYIEASIQISSNIERMKNELMKKLIQNIKVEFSRNYDKNSYLLDISNVGEGKNYEQINFTIPSFDEGYICFEFQGAGFDKPYIGIKINSDKTTNKLDIEKIKNTLKTELNGKRISSSSLWPAGYCFEPQNWKNFSEAWVLIDKDEMANKILEEMDNIFKVLDKNNCFDLLL
ncbi:PD-(D/E)XK nuclease family protein [uncultured Psychrobacter sp.]|uniref:PDDEXK-like family protein n=1 Tax=uncultured Psychrobacter sp. TaxID=259303 RepID=UPI003457CFD5